MLGITNRKGIVTRPIYSEYNRYNEDREEFPTLECRKCEHKITDYPFFKNGFEKYYHVECALVVGQITVAELEHMMKRIESSIVIGKETVKTLTKTLSDYIKKDKVIVFDSSSIR
jgi:hypothetical protein